MSYSNNNTSINMSSDLNATFLGDAETNYSNYLLESSGKINIFSSIVIIIVGLIGNSLTIFVFSQKRFRTNSSHVYLLCLAVNDSLFLVIHFFEDIIRTIKDIYLQNTNLNLLIKILNITDQYETACRLINYLRYFLRFISAYIVVTFTLQRLSIVYRPLSRNFKSKKSAWNTVIIIVCISNVINIWVPFLFELQQNESGTVYCDINKTYKTVYFQTNIAYICMIMLIPMLTIFICNSLIINKTFKDDSYRKSLRIVRADPLVAKKISRTPSVNVSSYNCTSDASNTNNNNNNNNQNFNNLINIYNNNNNANRETKRVKPHYLTLNQIINRNKKKSQNNSKKITILLIFISFSFIFLNFPYLTAWLFYSYDEAFNKLDMNLQNNLFTALQISEIFYVLNYGIKFFIYCASGSKFNNQLKYSSNLGFILKKKIISI